jgi:transcriptional regulator with XRE-family HTH domain
MQPATAPTTPSDLAPPGGKTLDQVMKARGLNDEQVGDLTGVTGLTIYRVRTGRAKPSYALIDKLIVAFEGELDGNSFFKRALNKAAATREVSPSGPFSSRSTSRPRAGSGGASRPSLPSSPTNSPVPAPSRPSSAKRSRP